MAAEEGGQSAGIYGYTPDIEALLSAENCAFRAGLSGVAGGVLGAGFGLIFGQFGNVVHPEEQKKLDAQPFKEQMKRGLRESGRGAWRSAKNFAFIGFAFSGTECYIEKYRGTTELFNGTLAGCLTGGALGIRTGPAGMAVGCVGFAAFSTAIDYLMYEV